MIDWGYFKGTPTFAAKARSLALGQSVSGWSAPKGSDMYFALTHFTIEHAGVDCYVVIDHYDFDPRGNPLNLLYFPEWAAQIAFAREFDVRASGGLNVDDPLA